MERKKNLLKQREGITLIALVVTIIVLIILATISINSVLRRKWDHKKSAGSKRDVQQQYDGRRRGNGTIARRI